MNLTLDQSWVRVKQISTKWGNFRASSDVVGLQSIRDELSESLLDIGFLETKLYHTFVMAEQTKKECLEDTMEELKVQYLQKKINLEFIKNEAQIRCRAFIRDEKRAEQDYKSVRTLTARCDQILHSVSSAIKTILKID